MIHLQWGRPGFDPWVGKIPWRRERLPSPLLWPGEFQRGCKESDTTERLSHHMIQQFHFWIAHCSVAKSCPTLCDTMHCSTPGFPVLHYLPELAQTHVHWSVMPSNHLILCHPLLLLPSIFPSIRVFSNKSALCFRWPKYWSFSFNISALNEYSGLISFGTG